jgi:hypothetical protein
VLLVANRPHPRGAETNPSSPRGWATCQRCGFVYNLFKLQVQADWAGTSIVSLNLQVCDTCLDEPQRQLGTIVLPPDPPPLMNALPEPYAIDEYWPRLLQNGQPRYLQGAVSANQNPRSLQYLNYDQGVGE